MLSVSVSASQEASVCVLVLRVIVSVSLLQCDRASLLSDSWEWASLRSRHKVRECTLRPKASSRAVCAKDDHRPSHDDLPLLRLHTTSQADHWPRRLSCCALAANTTPSRASSRASTAKHTTPPVSPRPGRTISYRGSDTSCGRARASLWLRLAGRAATAPAPNVLLCAWLRAPRWRGQGHPSRNVA